MIAVATTVWHGYQASWEMARGYPGAFGHRLNAPYVFLPLCALFLAGLADWRRPWRVANLDLLVLLGFGVSNLFLNRAEICVSLTATAMFVPRKTVSLLVGFGHRMPQWSRGERCAVCSSRERCPHRRRVAEAIAT